MKNEKKLLIIGLVVAVAVLVVACVANRYTDTDKFADEYGVKVPKGISIVYLKDENVISELSTKDKVVFLGSLGSDDAVKASSVLIKVAKYNGVDKIYYYDLSELDIKDEIADVLKEKTGLKDITAPTLFLVKDKKVSSVEAGYNKDIEEKYGDIMVEYIMCTKPDC